MRIFERVGIGSLVVVTVLAAPVFAGQGAMAQTTTQPAPPPPQVPQAGPAQMGDPTAPTTASAPPAGTMTKDQLKEQRKQQKRDEKAARDRVSASKASAKSKEANDKALQSEEKAGQVTTVPAATSTPTTTAAPQ